MLSIELFQHIAAFDTQPDFIGRNGLASMLVPNGSVVRSDWMSSTLPHIGGIYHAATGIMGSNDDMCGSRVWEAMTSRHPTLASEPDETRRFAVSDLAHNALRPTLASLTVCMRNIFFLARNELDLVELRIPFLAGGIFRAHMSCTLDEHAAAIVDTSVDAYVRLGCTFRVLFMDLEEGNVMAFDTQLARAIKRHKTRVTDSKAFAKRFHAVRCSLLARPSEVVALVGVDHDVADHGDANGNTYIVNAANMELCWGGGLSGVIAKAIGKRNARHIEQQLAVVREAYWKHYVNSVRNDVLRSDFDPRL